MPVSYQTPNLDVVDYGKINGLISRAYNSPMAQGQRLRMSQGVLPDFPNQNMRNYDAQSQSEIGYTQPIQEFIAPAQSTQYYKQPGGTSAGGTRMSQPTLKVAQPTTPIATAMPWNL